MHLIRVTYRATFQQPLQGPLNPINFKLSAPWCAEVYQASKDRWMVRTPVDRPDMPKTAPWPLQHGATAQQMILNVTEAFEKQLTPWERYGNPGLAGSPPRVLQPEEIEIRENGQIYFKDPPKETKQ